MYQQLSNDMLLLILFCKCLAGVSTSHTTCNCILLQDLIVHKSLKGEIKWASSE